MESGGIMFNREHTGYNSNSNNPDWEQIWELNPHRRFDLCTNNKTEAATNPTQHPAGESSHALFYQHCSKSLYAGGGSNLHPDPHLVCLKLGKRQYFEDATTAPIGERRVAVRFTTAKKGKPNYHSFGGAIGASSSCSPLLVTAVPRCQVEGCLAPLTNAKDYHRRHKVCEVHSKASKVMVLGLEQRFCQQCSRFHVASEFDESKRSCRRRLAGHNERRRKSSHHSLVRNSTQAWNNKLMTGATCPSPTGRALSLLSSNKPKADDYSCWISSSDLSSRCSAALGELIAENRAAILARHVILDGHARDWRHYQHLMLTDQHNWGLDLMQPPSKELRFLSTKDDTNNGDEDEEEEHCSYFWSSLEGDHAV